MKNLWIKWSALCLSVLLATSSGMALAASGTAAPATKPESFTVDAPSPRGMKVTGVLRTLGDGRALLVNDEEGAAYPEIILNLSEKTKILDAITGLPAEELSVGEKVVAYVGAAMTRSLPPMVHAEIILCDIPDGFAPPAYLQVLSTGLSEDGRTAQLTTDGDLVLHVQEDCRLSGYLTKQAVLPADLKPGTRLLAWYDVVASSQPAQAWPRKLMVFPYQYQGTVEVALDGALTVDSKPLSARPYTLDDGTLMLPLGAIAEALGLTGRQTAEGYALYRGEERLLCVSKDGTAALEADGEQTTLYAPLETRGGQRCLSLNDLRWRLHLFVAQKA